MADIVIVVSASGAAQVHERGHHTHVPLAISVSAAGPKVRRELLPAGLDDTVSADLLAALGRLMTAHDLWTAYSTPVALHTDVGALDTVAVRGALVEAQTSGVRTAKFQSGGFAGDVSAELPTRLLQGWRARMLVENGQQAVGGSLSQFQDLSGASEATDVADMLGMTFDVGNREWAGKTPLTYAQALAPYVEYIHCKSVAGEGARRPAVAPAGSDARLAAAPVVLLGDVLRGIEFPFNVVDPAADAHQHVMRLKAA